MQPSERSRLVAIAQRMVLAVVPTCLFMIGLVVPAQAASTFNFTFGSYGSENGQLTWPQGNTLDSEHNLLVADYENDRIEKFNDEGEYVGQFGSTGSSHGQFEYPTGVAVDQEGDIWVADFANGGRVQQFDSTGKYLSEASVQNAYALAVGPDNHIYVTGSYGQGVVVDLNQAREVVRWWVIQGNSFGAGITVDQWGRVWVADQYNNRILKLTSEEKISVVIQGSGAEEPGNVYGPGGVAVDCFGDLYVADTYNSRVQKFHSNGTFVETFGAFGEENEEGAMGYPAAVTADSNCESIWVTDSYYGQVQNWLTK